jgi:hypothetical protein
MTSKDVVFTFTRILDAKNKLPMRVFFPRSKVSKRSVLPRCAFT